MIRRPPRSTLFPTRRSSDLDGDERQLDGVVDLDQVRVALQLGKQDVLQGDGEVGLLAEVLVVGAERDRKSTRLNSSHITISYAVFCLKKKNKQITYATRENI